MTGRARMLFLSFLLLPLCLTDALAHKTSVTYLDLTDKQLAQGIWSVQLLLPVEELDLRFDLDMNGDSQLSRAELNQKVPTVIDYAKEGIDLSALTGSLGHTCERSFINHHLDQHHDSPEPGLFLALRLQFRCPAEATSLMLRYDLFAEFDSAHRALLSFAGSSRLLVPGVSERLLVLKENGEEASNESVGHLLLNLRTYIGGGFHHILIGWDHLAFLIALIIPIMAGQAGFTKSQAKSLFVTVTAFTLGHSISLAAAVLGWITIPAQFVEAIIAASIVVAAGSCLLKRELSPGPLLAASFGLIHGFGFANVFELAGTDGIERWTALLGFNLGVEAGQLVFIALALPMLALIAFFSVSRPFLTRALPVALMITGAGWFAERLTDIDLIPG